MAGEIKTRSRLTILCILVTFMSIFLTSLPPVSGQTLCASTFDAIFIVDNSGSIRDSNVQGQPDNWQVMLDFMAAFAKRFQVGPGTSGVMRAALVDFGHTGKVQSDFLTSANTLDAAILGLQYRTDGESTNTSDAIYKMTTQLVGNVTAGNRPGVEDVAIILTDGKSTDSATTLRFAQDARVNKGVKIFCIGVTSSVNITEIRLMSSSPQQLGESFWMVPDFGSLNAAVEGITSKICAVQADSTTPTPTTTTTTTPAPTTTTTTTPVPSTQVPETTSEQLATNILNPGILTTTLQGNVPTTQAAIVPAAAASTTSSNTIYIVLIVLGLLLFLALLILLLVCCCYGAIAAWCGRCCKREERLIDRRKAVIVPFSTAVIKPPPVVKEQNFAHMTTQCDLREPVPLPKPVPPPEVRTEVVIQPVCNTCKMDIEDCVCVAACPYQCQHGFCSENSCTMCQPNSTCPQCQPPHGCSLCHGHGTNCRACIPISDTCHMCNHGHGYDSCSACNHHGSHLHSGGSNVMLHSGHLHGGGNLVPIDHMHSGTVVPFHGGPSGVHRGQMHGAPLHNKRRYANRTNHGHRPHHYGNGHYTDTDYSYTHRSNYSTAANSDVESCSSRIYLVPQVSQTKSLGRVSGRRSRIIELPPPPIVRGTATLQLHSTESMDESVSRGRKKPRRKRRVSKPEAGMTTASDAESVASKKDYVYLPLECPDKMRNETQAYLNKLYNTSRSSIHEED